MKGNKIIHLIDLKMDLGWKRDGFSVFCKNIDLGTKSHQGKRASLKNGRTKEPLSTEFGKNCKYHIVIVSSVNIKREKFNGHIKEAKKLKNTSVYTLSHEVHPNTYKKRISDIAQIQPRSA